MRDDIFLPEGYVWIGFDNTGRSIAASIEKRKPTTGRRSVFDGCVSVVKCKRPADGGLFGRRLADFEPVP